jgi:hypothetical protein
MIKINRKQVSPYRTALLELLDGGVLSADALARDLCGWLSESDVKQFVEANDLPITDQDEDQQVEDYSTMETVQQFVDACKQLSGDQIYELFYNAADDLREAVYEKAAALGVDFDGVEPGRATMIALGEHYHVQSLIDY